MTLITEKVRINAEKCRECVLTNLRRVALEKAIKESTSILMENAKVAADVFARISCTVCPNQSDFEKVYGMTPYEYFTSNNLKGTE